MSLALKHTQRMSSAACRGTDPSKQRCRRGTHTPARSAMNALDPCCRARITSLSIVVGFSAVGATSPANLCYTAIGKGIQNTARDEAREQVGRLLTARGRTHKHDPHQRPLRYAIVVDDIVS